jgi:hypothetical protein
MSKAKVSDLRKYYPDMESADREYPPLKFKSLKGKVSAAEWQARVDCACAYRLVKHYGMDDLVYNHISVRVPGTDHYLLNAMGLMYDEICASSLLRVSLMGELLWQPEWPKGLDYKFNYAGFVIHGAIHEAKPELHCVIHTHSVASMAVSSLKKGLLPMTQMAMRFDKVAYHPTRRGARPRRAEAYGRQPRRLRRHAVPQPLFTGGVSHRGRCIQLDLPSGEGVPRTAPGAGRERRDLYPVARGAGEDEPRLQARRAPRGRAARVAGDAPARRPHRPFVQDLEAKVD